MTASPPTIPERRPPRVTPGHESEPPFWIYLLVSVIAFAVFFACGAYLQPREILKTVEVDLPPLADAVENEPPPLGDPDAGAKAEPEPPPEPEPEPPPVEPPPPVQPEFIKPEEKPPPATPPPKPAPPKPLPKPVKPSGTPAPRPTAPGSGDNPDPNAKPGLRGSPSGVPGGRGGSAGDFTSRPNPQYDNLALTRHYEGQGRAKIVYENGRVLDVEITSSTGVSYLDTRSVMWIKANWHVKAGASGTATLPIIWTLPKAR